MSEQLSTQVSRDEARKVVMWVSPTPSDGAHVSLASALSCHIPALEHGSYIPSRYGIGKTQILAPCG